MAMAMVSNFSRIGLVNARLDSRLNSYGNRTGIKKIVMHCRKLFIDLKILKV